MTSTFDMIFLSIVHLLDSGEHLDRTGRVWKKLMNLGADLLRFIRSRSGLFGSCTCWTVQLVKANPKVSLSGTTVWINILTEPTLGLDQLIHVHIRSKGPNVHLCSSVMLAPQSSSSEIPFLHKLYKLNGNN